MSAVSPSLVDSVAKLGLGTIAILALVYVLHGINSAMVEALKTHLDRVVQEDREHVDAVVRLAEAIETLVAQCR